MSGIFFCKILIGLVMEKITRKFASALFFRDFGREWGNGEKFDFDFELNLNNKIG